MDPICAKTVSVSCMYDLVLLCDLLDAHIAPSKCSAAIGSTTARVEDPDSVVHLWENESGCESITKMEDSQMHLQEYLVQRNRLRNRGPYMNLGWQLPFHST